MFPQLKTLHSHIGPGSFLYALTCIENEKFIVKLGVSDNPMKRLDQLRHGIPFKAKSFAVLQMPSRKLAFEMESRLLKRFKEWKTRGEWMQFGPEDKPVFNSAVRHAYSSVLHQDLRPQWTQINVREVDRRKQAAQEVWRKRYAKMGMARRDFIKHSKGDS